MGLNLWAMGKDKKKKKNRGKGQRQTLEHEEPQLQTMAATWGSEKTSS